MMKKWVILICTISILMTSTHWEVYANNINEKTAKLPFEQIKNSNYTTLYKNEVCETVSALYEIDENGNEKLIDADISVSYNKLKNNDYIISVQGNSSDDKISANSKESNGLTLRGTIAWTDVSGTENKLRYVSGSCLGACEFNSYAYGTGPYYLNTTWHKEENFGQNFFDNRDKGKTANSFVLEIKAKPVGKSKVVLRVYTSLLD